MLGPLIGDVLITRDLSAGQLQLLGRTDHRLGCGLQTKRYFAVHIQERLQTRFQIQQQDLGFGILTERKADARSIDRDRFGWRERVGLRQRLFDRDHLETDLFRVGWRRQLDPFGVGLFLQVDGQGFPDERRAQPQIVAESAAGQSHHAVAQMCCTRNVRNRGIPVELHLALGRSDDRHRARCGRVRACPLRTRLAIQFERSPSSPTAQNVRRAPPPAVRRAGPRLLARSAPGQVFPVRTARSSREQSHPDPPKANRSPRAVHRTG